MRNQARSNSNEAQQSENEKAIINLKNKIEEIFKKLFTEKYKEVGVNAYNGHNTRQFKDSLFSGNINSEYLKNLDQYFKKKGYNLGKNNNSLNEASRLYKIITSRDPSDLKINENRFKIFKDQLQQIKGKDLLRNLSDNLDEKLTTEESKISENSNPKMPKRTRRDTSSLESIDAKKLAADCLEKRSLEFQQIVTGEDKEKEQKLQSLANSLFNDINLYSLFETLFHIKDIESTHLSKQKTEYYFSASLNVKGEADVDKLNEPIRDDIKDILFYSKTNFYHPRGYIYYLIQHNQQKLYFQFDSKGLTTEYVGRKKNDLLEKANDMIKSNAKLQNLSLLSPEFFVTRLVNNFKSTFGKEIEDDLRQTIESISNVPQDIDKVFDLLKNDASGIPSIISQLKAVENAFTISTKDLKDKINKFVGEDGNLTKLFEHFQIDYSYFNEVGKSLDDGISKYVEFLKADIENQIKEKNFIIEQIREQYLSAYNKVAKEINIQHINATSIYENVVFNIKGMDQEKQEKIKDNLPLWVRDGFALVDVGIKDENGRAVKFIFNKAQSNIIESLKSLQSNESSDQSKLVRFKDFYVGTGGGKTHLIELLQGTQGRTIKGSNGQDYSAEQIKKAIFGNANVVIKSINFDSFYDIAGKKKTEKGNADIEKYINDFFSKLSVPGQNKQNQQFIIPLDEYHLFPDYAQKYLRDKAEASNIKILFLKSTATPDSTEELYKLLKPNTKKKDDYSRIRKENELKIDKITVATDQFIRFVSNEVQETSVTRNIFKNPKGSETEKKYHIIINPEIVENEEEIIKFGESQAKEDEILIIQKKVNGRSYYYVFKNKELQKADNPSEMLNFLQEKQLKDLLTNNHSSKIKLICPFSTAAGGDFGIEDFAGNAKITVNITDHMKNKYSATEMVAFIRQAVGRDRSFNWKASNSFNNVELNGITKQELKGILEKAKKFQVLGDKIKERQYPLKNRATQDDEYCSKDIDKIVNYIYLKVKKLQSKTPNSYDPKLIAQIVKWIDTSPQESKNETIYNNIMKLVGNIDNPKVKNNLDTIFALSSLFSFVKQYKEQKNFIINNQEVRKIFQEIDSYYKSPSLDVMTEYFKQCGEKQYIKNNIRKFLRNNNFQDNYSIEITDEKSEFMGPEGCYNGFDIKFNIKFSPTAEQHDNYSRQKESLASTLSKIKDGEDGLFSFSKLLSFLTKKNKDLPLTLGKDQIERQSGDDFVSNNEECENNLPHFNFHREEKKGNSVEARVIVRLFENVLGDKDNKFTDENKKLINNFYFSSSSSPDKVLSKEEKLQFVESALLQRNKYNNNGGKNTDKDRSGKHYQVLKKTLQNLNKKNIKFTTESLKLFNVDNKTLGTRQEIDDLIAKKPLFVRAMGNSTMSSFKNIDTTNVPDKNILLLTGTKPSKLQTRLSYLKEERHNDSNQK